MKRAKLQTYTVMLVYGIAFALCVIACAGCTSAQWQKTKAHSVEVGFSGAGGAAAVLIGGFTGPLVFFGMAVTGVLLNEQLQPAEGVTVVTTDARGKTKVEHFQPKERRDTPPETTSFFGGIVELLTGIVRWAAYLLIGLFIYKLFWPRYRKSISSAIRNVFTLHPIDAIKDAHRAGGMMHTSKGKE